jgi:hypothetical protein
MKNKNLPCVLKRKISNYMVSHDHLEVLKLNIDNSIQKQKIANYYVFREEVYASTYYPVVLFLQRAQGRKVSLLR